MISLDNAIELEYVTFGQYRTRLVRDCDKKIEYSKNDHRFQDTIYCNACGRPLVAYKMMDMNYASLRAMYKVWYNGTIAYLCKDAYACHQARNEKYKGETPIRMVKGHV